MDKTTVNTPDDALQCQDCQENIEWHTCPFKEDLFGDGTICHCCNSCRQRCCDEI